MKERQSEVVPEQDVWNAVPAHTESNPFLVVLTHKRLQSIQATLFVDREKKELEFAYIRKADNSEIMSSSDLARLWITTKEVMQRYGCGVMTVKPINQQISAILERFDAPSVTVEKKDGEIEHWKRVPIAQVEEIAKSMSRRLSGI